MVLISLKPVIPLALLGLLIFPHFACGEIQAKPTQLSDQETHLIEWVHHSRISMLNDLETYVNINTGTFNHEGINRYRNLLEKELQSLGFRTTTRPGGDLRVLSCREKKMVFAEHLEARLQGKKPIRIFLNGHLDTVFAKDDEFQTLIREEDGRLKGPGVLDMKGGTVAMLYALKSLHHHGRLQDVALTVFLNTDEEVGSLGSRPYLEELATQHDVGFIFEGTFNHKLVRQRKGLGQALLKVTGREAHAGNAHEEGISASLELAHKVIKLEALTNYNQRKTVSVGTLQGGEKRNTRPGCAEAGVDFRFQNEKDGLDLQAQIHDIATTQYTHYPRFPDLPKSEIWTLLHRPAKTVHPITDHLIADAMGLSHVIGEPIVGTFWSGGGTDGSITQKQGLPTLDSLGLNGGGAHSSREWTTVQSLMARTKLLSVLLDRLINLENHWLRNIPKGK